MNPHVQSRIRRKRPSLRLIVSSATLDAVSFLEYFKADMGPDEAVIASLEGRMYPVEVAYLQESTPDYVKKAAEVAFIINKTVCVRFRELSRTLFRPVAMRSKASAMFLSS